MTPPPVFFYPFPIHPSRNICVNFGVQHDQFIGVAWPAFLLNTAISQPSCPLFALLCPRNFPSPAPPCSAPLSSAARLSHTCRYLGRTAADLNCETPQNLFRPWTYNLLRLWNCDLNQNNWPPTANTLLVLLKCSHIYSKCCIFMWLFWICGSVWASFNKAKHWPPSQHLSNHASSLRMLKRKAYSCMYLFLLDGAFALTITFHGIPSYMQMI